MVVTPLVATVVRAEIVLVVAVTAVVGLAVVVVLCLVAVVAVVKAPRSLDSTTCTKVNWGGKYTNK